MTTTVSTRIKGHVKVGGPERFVHTRKIDTHLVECFNKVMSRFDSQVSHSAEPIVHSLDSPVSIFVEEVPVSPDESTKSFFFGRYITIVH